MVVLLREIEIKGAANFLIVSILVFYEKNYLEKSHNNIKSERKLREKHLFCASKFTFKVKINLIEPFFTKINNLKMKLGHFW